MKGKNYGFVWACVPMVSFFYSNLYLLSRRLLDQKIKQPGETQTKIVNHIITVLLLSILSTPLIGSAQSFNWFQKIQSQDYSNIVEVTSSVDAIYAAGTTECGFPFCK